MVSNIAHQAFAPVLEALGLILITSSVQSSGRIFRLLHLDFSSRQQRLTLYITGVAKSEYTRRGASIFCALLRSQLRIKQDPKQPLVDLLHSVCSRKGATCSSHP